MVNKRFQQFAPGILIVLSLFAAPLAACICSHQHGETATAAVSHHHHSQESADHSAPGLSDSTAVLGLDDECVCFQPAPKTLTKSENVTLKQQASAPSIPSLIETPVFRKLESSAVERSTHLSKLDAPDSFTPSRGPPARS